MGVNLGQTLLAVKSIRSDWDYIGFEPNPYCVFYTMNLVKLNTLEGCTIFPFGIGETTGAMDLRLNSLTGGEGSIVAGFRSESDYKRRIKVPILGAEVLPGELLEHKVGVLKVDVEGGELDVFRAMRPVLRKAPAPHHHRAAAHLRYHDRTGKLPQGASGRPDGDPVRPGLWYHSSPP